MSFFGTWSPKNSNSKVEDSLSLLNLEPAPELEKPNGPKPTGRSWFSIRTRDPDVSLTPRTFHRNARDEAADLDYPDKSTCSEWCCNRVCFVISALLLLDVVLLSVIFWSKFFVTDIPPSVVTLTRRQDVLEARQKEEQQELLHLHEHKLQPFISNPAVPREAEALSTGIVGRPADLLEEMRASPESRHPDCSRRAVIFQTTRDTGEHWIKKAGLHLRPHFSAVEASHVSVDRAWVGARVRRGRDWKKAYGNQDGGVGSAGTVTHVGALGAELCSVRWDKGQDGTYRAGVDNKFELEFLPGEQASLPNLTVGRSEGSQGLKTLGFALNLEVEAATLKDIPQAADAVSQSYFGDAGLRYRAGVVREKAEQNAPSHTTLMKLLVAARAQLEEQKQTLQILRPQKDQERRLYSGGIVGARSLASTSTDSRVSGNSTHSSHKSGAADEDGWPLAEALASRLLEGLGRVRLTQAWTDPERESRNLAKDSQRPGEATASKVSLVKLEGSGLWTRVRPQPAYYLVGQLSRYVPAGSIRLGSLGKAPHSSTGRADDKCEGLHAAAFRRPDSQVVVVALNCGAAEVPLELHRGSKSARARIPPHSMQTILLEVPCSKTDEDD